MQGWDIQVIKKELQDLNLIPSSKVRAAFLAGLVSNLPWTDWVLMSCDLACPPPPPPPFPCGRPIRPTVRAASREGRTGSCTGSQG